MISQIFFFCLNGWELDKQLLLKSNEILVKTLPGGKAISAGKLDCVFIWVRKRLKILIWILNNNNNKTTNLDVYVSCIELLAVTRKIINVFVVTLGRGWLFYYKQAVKFLLGRGSCLMQWETLTSDQNFYGRGNKIIIE